MAEEIDQPGAGDPDASLDEPIGDEIRVRGGGVPPWLRWWGYLLHVWAAAYLLAHPPVDQRLIVLVFGGVVVLWLLFYALTRRPSEL